MEMLRVSDCRMQTHKADFLRLVSLVIASTKRMAGTPIEPVHNFAEKNAVGEVYKPHPSIITLSPFVCLHVPRLRNSVITYFLMTNQCKYHKLPH